MRVRTLWFILLAGLISVAASLIGGLLMYVESLRMLEQQVEEGSRSDLQAVGGATKQIMDNTFQNAIKYGEMITRLDILDSNAAISSWLSARGLSDVIHSPSLEAGQIFGYHNETNELFGDMIWWEPLRTGSRDYVSCKHLPGIDDEETECAYPCIMCWSVNPNNGSHIENIYNFSDPEIVEVLVDTHEGKTDENGIFTEWAVPAIWFSADETPYMYLSVSAVFTNPITDQHLKGFRILSICDFEVQSSWVRVLNSHATESSMMIANTDTGVNSTVLAGNFPESQMEPNCSNSTREVDTEVFHPCLKYVRDLPRFMQDVHYQVNKTAPRQFKKVSTNKGDYWINRFVVFEKGTGDHLSSLNLIWFRSVDSVDGEMKNALLMFILFVCLVLLFDVVIGCFEILLLAKPLKQLSQAMVPLDVMDLDGARKLAEGSCSDWVCISEVDSLKNGFLTAIENLREFKAFIPQTLFESDEVIIYDSTYNRPPPLSKNGDAAVAFTDIQSSTSIWEQCPEGMKRDLRLHNSIVRDCIKLSSGYEVKTIGDSFMVAFDTSLEACMFGVLVQTKLYESDEWDAKTLQLSECSYAAGKWRGLRVRIGIHFGAVDVEENRLTGISDYFGPTVNTAARLESAGIGGSVTISELVYEELKAHPDQSVLNNCTVVPITEEGKVYLKGISEPQKVFLMVPTAVIARLPEIRLAAFEKFKPPRAAKQAFINDTSSVVSSVSAYSDDSGSGNTRVFQGNSANLHLSSTNSCTLVHVGMRTSYAVRSLGSLTALNELLSTIFETSSRLEGILVSVTATAVIASWNTQKRCIQHMQQGIRFTGLLYQHLSRGVCGWELHGNVCCGMSTGDAKFGNCGSTRQRYVMVVGHCVEIAHTLATLARKLGAFALTASAPGHIEVSQDSALQGLQRPVAILHLSPKESTTVYQLRETSLKDYGKVKVTLLSECDPLGWGWSQEYSDAFKNRDISEIEKQGCGDPTLMNVLELLESEPEVPEDIPQLHQVVEWRRKSLTPANPLVSPILDLGKDNNTSSRAM